MDITFHCTECNQELETDASAAGSQITCPACNKTITIPHPDATNLRHINAMASSAAAKEERHFSVPVRDEPTPVLIEKPKKPLEAAAKEGSGNIHARCIRRVECIEVGHDRFEQIVTEFLQKVGEGNIISITTVNYSYVDMGSRQILSDFGVLIIYRGGQQPH